MKRLIIAIDGPAASGKSTTAKFVAERLGYLHVDTGAMYRAFTLKVLHQRVDVQNAAEIVKLVPQTTVRLLYKGERQRALLDGIDVSEEIRKPEVTKAVSAVSSIPEVRALMVREQQAMGKNGGIVLEGRDIGTVVFPNADVKIFMIADARERARRRSKELSERGTNIPLDELERDIVERDEKDASRTVSPLQKAKDAVVLDTTTLSVEEQVDFIVAKAMEKMK
ncbi:MAG: (d)CMP kinase [Bacteroidota bacterium]|nr:(d)CMP kinase [Bacteroidota bacterium]